MTTITWIGLGHMGSPMSANLVKAGYDVRGFDLSEAAMSAAHANGVKTCGSMEEALQGADVVFTMLPKGEHARAAYLGEEGILELAPEDALLIDSSTIDVESALALHKAADEAGFVFVDAPVSGGISGAAAGTLTFMIGGSDEAFARATAVLEPMGKAVIHAGSAGAGQAAKICNNMMLGIHMIGTCEGFAMAQKLGLDPQVFYDIASVSSGQSWSVTSYCPVPGVGPQTPADNGYQGGFATTLMLKDLRLAMQAADTAEVDAKMGRRAMELYEAFEQAGNGGLDFSAIIETA